jgi:GNAT superfamily N-acetyltransferase
MRATRRKRSSIPALPPLDLSTNAIVLSGRSGELHADLAVRQTAEMHWRDLAMPLEGDGIRHVFELTVEAYSLEDPLGERLSEEDIIPQELGDYAIPERPDVVTPERLRVGQLEVDEFPVHMVTTSYFSLLDGIGEEGDVLAGLIDEVTNENSDIYVECALLDGSFIWPRTLAIHPKLQGRGLGIRLLAHALYAMHRSAGDLAAFGVETVASSFGDPKRKLTPSMLAGYKRYYGRIGFIPWDGDEHVVYLPLGLKGMPVRGIGGLSSPSVLKSGEPELSSEK